jgi:5'-nucleotidase
MKNIRHLTLLHSNDLHGDFLAEPMGDTFVGGISMLSGYIRHVRRTEENVLYSISGDIFRGSVIDTEYLGVSTIEMLNLLSPDVVTIGNHEIDYGIAHLLFIEKCADFPIINANLYIKMNGKRLFTPCRIAETGGMRVLFLGLITEDVMAQAKQDVIGSFIETRDAVREIRAMRK